MRKRVEINSADKPKKVRVTAFDYNEKQCVEKEIPLNTCVAYKNKTDHYLDQYRQHPKPGSDQGHLRLLRP